MKPLTFGFIFLLAFTLTSGCASTKDASKPNPIVEKKKKLEQLYKELTENAIAPGTPTTEIREKFGEPDDIFNSGSSTSSLEIWTYDQIILGKSERSEWETILLYFDNKRLMSWRY